MDIARYAIDKPVLTWMIILFCFFGGIWGFATVGKLEDPSFTIKQAMVTTNYPGAMAVEVEEQITEVVETAIQQLGQIDFITSKSLPGRSEIQIEIKSTVNSSDIPQVWDELRRKVSDIQASLPEGAQQSRVIDDFGDVFGLFYAVTGPGLSDKLKRDIADTLRRELLTVPGVARVETAGEPSETIYVEVSNERLTSLGVSSQEIIAAVQGENEIAPAGSVRVGDKRIRLEVKAKLNTAQALADIRIGVPGSTDQIRLIDIARISREPTELPSQIIRYSGEDAFTIAVAGVSDANIVEVGKAVSEKLDALKSSIPLGVELHPIYEQHAVVEESLNGFLLNLAMSVAIVIGVLCIFMGWRVGLVVGVTLLLTVLGSLFFMAVFDIQMERISLGALIIAMGMLVDNAIVIAEGMLIHMQMGKSAREGAGETARRTQVPLLGATVIGIMAFAGIGLSQDTTGEFMFSLFAVVGISLLLSWLLAVTVTPLLGHYLLRPAHGGDAQSDPYGSGIYAIYRNVLRQAFRLRRTIVVGLVLMTGGSVLGMGLVKQSFFPDSNTPMFYVDYWLPQGTDIHATARDMREIESFILAQEGVVSTATFIARGASRYTLTYQPEQSNTSYGQFIIRVLDRDEIDALATKITDQIAEHFPDAQARALRIVFGPGGGAKIEARFTGPDADELRRLGEIAMDRLAAGGMITDIRHNWRQRELTIVPRIRSDRARIAGIDRTDVANALQFATTGVRAGTYREGDDLIPIVARPPRDERRGVERLNERMIWSANERVFVPISQVVERFDSESYEVLIHRRDKKRTLSVQANPIGKMTAADAFAAIREDIEAIPLKPGYGLEWGGEHENSSKAQGALGATLPVTLIVMLTISVLLFMRLRQPFIVWAVVPMAMCGVVLGLLLTGLPFTFTALLGLLSLSGMLMKNAIVLVDEVDERSKQEELTQDTIIDASVTRLRPVFLAAVTTILGMLPLLRDAFFSSMSVTIMGGLAFATVLTLLAVPVLYSLVFGVVKVRHTD